MDRPSCRASRSVRTRRSGTRPPLRRAGLLVGGVLGAAVGCSDSPFGLAERVGLARAEQRWAARGFSDYSYEQRTSCFCPPEIAEWAVVEVRGGRVTSARLLTGAELPQDQYPRPSIEEIFETVRTERSDWVKDVDAEFDATLGYPTRVTFNAKSEYLDAGATYQARNVQPLP